MFGLLDDLADIATSVVGSTVEVASLGLISSKDAKRLSDTGWSVFKISQTYGISESEVSKLLEK